MSTKKPTKPTKHIKNTQKPAHGGFSPCSAGWSTPETAPKDSTTILGYFGYPWPQLAAWNSHDEKWATVCMLAQGMENGTNDIWFEAESEGGKQLRRWTHLPSLPSLPNKGGLRT